MKYLLHLILLFLMGLSACQDDDEGGTSSVSASGIYQVNRAQGIPYAKALVGSWYDRNGLSEEELRLDFYEPIGGSVQKRPVILLLHGGGFSSGSREDGAVVTTALYFASRGWVVYSIDYRLNGTPSLIPTDWPPREMVDEVRIGASFTPSPSCPNIDQFANEPEGCGTITEIDRLDSDDDVQRVLQNYRTMYGAGRDVKAAIRYIHATAVSFGADPDRITIMGTDAGASLALMAGVANHGDFTNEVSMSEDPTLEDTTPQAPERVRSVVSFYGSTVVLDLLEAYVGESRYGNDSSLFLWHGKQDNFISYYEALDVLCNYSETGGEIDFRPQCGGHGIIDTIGALQEAMNFIISDQSLRVE